MIEAPYLPEFLYEIAVGYHELDSDWAEPFQKQLTLRVNQLLDSGTARVWGFGEIRGNEPALATKRANLAASATLVAVLSPRYVGPEGYYGTHWELFAETLDPFTSQTRLFKVFKLPCEPPKLWQDEPTGYQFWDRDAKGREIELFPLLDEKRHLLEVSGLARDIKDILSRQTIDKRPLVYLAECSEANAEVYKRRAELREYLRAFCRVSPRTPLDRSSYANYRNAVLRSMERCVLSIHLLGEADDAVPPGFPDESPVQVQLSLARERAVRRELAAIAWCPETSLAKVPDDPKPDTFDLLCPESFEALKTRIRERIAQPIPPVNQAKTLYLARHPQDAAAVQPMADALTADGYRITLPSFDHTSPNFETDQNQKLATVHGAVICAGNGPSTYLPFVHKRLLANLGQNVLLPLDRCGVYLGPAKNDSKEQFQEFTPLKTLVDYQSFSAGTLKPLLDRL